MVLKNVPLAAVDSTAPPGRVRYNSISAVLVVVTLTFTERLVTWARVDGAPETTIVEFTPVGELFGMANSVLFTNVPGVAKAVEVAAELKLDVDP